MLSSEWFHMVLASPLNKDIKFSCDSVCLDRKQDNLHFKQRSQRQPVLLYQPLLKEVSEASSIN